MLSPMSRTILSCVVQDSLFCRINAAVCASAMAYQAACVWPCLVNLLLTQRVTRAFWDSAVPLFVLCPPIHHFPHGESSRSLTAYMHQNTHEFYPSFTQKLSYRDVDL